LLQIYLVEKDFSAMLTASSMQTTRILHLRQCEGAFARVFAWVLAANTRSEYSRQCERGL